MKTLKKLTNKETVIISSMTLEERIIFDRLTHCAADNGGDADLSPISPQIQKMKALGWESDDIYNYLRRTQEVNPNITEKRALALMSGIAAKYKKP